MKKKLCKICKTRYSRQQAWKSEEEKEICLSCRFVINTAKVMIKALKNIANEKKVDLEIKAKIGNDYFIT